MVNYFSNCFGYKSTYLGVQHTTWSTLCTFVNFAIDLCFIWDSHLQHASSRDKKLRVVVVSMEPQRKDNIDDNYVKYIYHDD